MVLFVAVVALDDGTMSKGRFLALATYDEITFLVLEFMRDSAIFSRSTNRV